jgi:hypothetical protein
MLRAQPKQVLDPDLERVGDGRCVEGGADLRQRDCHGRSLFCGNLCGGAANALGAFGRCSRKAIAAARFRQLV